MRFPVLVHSPTELLNLRFINLLQHYERNFLLFLPMSHFDSPFVGHCPFYAFMFLQFDEQTAVEQEISQFCDILRNMDKEIEFTIVLVPHDKQGVLCAPEKFHRLEFMKLQREHVIMKFDDNFDELLQEAVDCSKTCLRRRISSLEEQVNGADTDHLLRIWTNQMVLNKYYGESEFYSFMEPLCQIIIDHVDAEVLSSCRDGDQEFGKEGRLFYAQRMDPCVMLGILGDETGKRYFSILEAKEAPILNFEVGGVVVNTEIVREIVECEEFFEDVNNGTVGLLGFLTYVFCLSINSSTISSEQMFCVYQYCTKLLKRHPEFSAWQYKIARLLLEERISFVFEMRLQLHILVALRNMRELMDGVGFSEMVDKFKTLIEGHPDEDIRDNVYTNDILLREYFKMFTRCPYWYFIQDVDIYDLLEPNGRLAVVCQAEFEHILETITLCPSIEPDLIQSLLRLSAIGYLEHNCQLISALWQCVKQIKADDAISAKILGDNLSIVFESKLYCCQCDQGQLERLLVYEFALSPSEITLERLQTLQFQQQIAEQHYEIPVPLSSKIKLLKAVFGQQTKYEQQKFVVYETTDDETNKLLFALESQFLFKYLKIEFQHSSLGASRRQAFYSELSEGAGGADAEDEDKAGGLGEGKGETDGAEANNEESKNEQFLLQTELLYKINAGIEEIDQHYFLSRISVSFDNLQWFNVVEKQIAKADVSRSLQIVQHRIQQFTLSAASELHVHTVPMQHHFHAELANTQLFKHFHQIIEISVQENVNMDIYLYIIIPDDVKGVGEIRIPETGQVVTDQQFSCELGRFTLEVPVFLRKAQSCLYILVKSCQKEQKVEIPLIANNIFNINVETSIDRIGVFFQPLLPISQEARVELAVNGICLQKEYSIAQMRQYCVSVKLERPLEDIDFKIEIILKEGRFCIATTIVNETHTQVLNRQLGPYQLTKPFSLQYRLSCGAKGPRTFSIRAPEFFLKGPETVLLEAGEERDVKVEFLARATGIFSFPWYYCVEDFGTQYPGMELLDDAGDIHIGDEVVELQHIE